MGRRDRARATGRRGGATSRRDRAVSRKDRAVSRKDRATGRATTGLPFGGGARTRSRIRAVAGGA